MEFKKILVCFKYTGHTCFLANLLRGHFTAIANKLSKMKLRHPIVCPSKEVSPFSEFVYCILFTQEKGAGGATSKQIKHPAVKPDKIFLCKLTIHPQPSSIYTISKCLFNCILKF